MNVITNIKAMSSKKILLLALGFVVCYVAIGMAYWQIPYTSLSLPDSLYTPGLLLVFISAFAFCVSGTGFLWSSTVLGCSAPFVVATRIIVDIVRDSSTHNLFPFELAIAIVIGFSVSSFGAFLGVLIRKFFVRFTH